MACLIRLTHPPVPPPRPNGRPLPKPGPRAGLAARAHACGTLGTVLLATLAALSMTLLCGCGGGEAGDETRSEKGESATASRPAAVDFSLESEYGPGDAPGSSKREASDARVERGHLAAVPVDPKAQTRAGRYLNRIVAERLYEEGGGRAVWLDAGCCVGLDRELPERIAFGMQAMLGGEASLFISGSDQREAARLADRLDALGVGRVYLVTP